jgi:hypothetical protein
MGVRFAPDRAFVVPYIAPRYLPAYGAAPYAPSYTTGAMPSYAAMPNMPPAYGSPGGATATIMTGRAVASGQQIAASIDGFTAGEMVSAAITAPNGRMMQAGSAAAAGDGSVTIMVTFRRQAHGR